MAFAQYAHRLNTPETILGYIHLDRITAADHPLIVELDGETVTLKIAPVGVRSTMENVVPVNDPLGQLWAETEEIVNQRMLPTRKVRV